MRSTVLVPLALLSLTFSCGRGFEPTPHRPDALVACEELGRGACAARSDCNVEQFACAAVCADDGFGSCAPCEAFACVPVTPPSPAACEQLDASACGGRSDCQLETAVCAALCEDDGLGGCLPCDAPSRCVTKLPPPPGACEQLDPTVCASTPGCALAATGACPPCPDGAVCANCEAASVCVTVLPSSCDGLDATTCTASPGCGALETSVCPVCEPDGPCAPCQVGFACVPMEPPSPCLGLDVASCGAYAECEVVAFACTADCRDDGAGGCLPCDAPPPSCQPRPEEPIAGCGSGGSQPPQP